MGFNTKLEINRKIIYLIEPKGKSIGQILFNNLIEFSQKFIMNDDGNKFKKQLFKFDISQDKKFGRYWDFKINSDSKKILPKVFNHYLNNKLGHWFWSLKGADFSLEYQECGDEEYSEEDLKAKSPKVYNDFKIKAKGNSLKLIKRIIKNYK